MWRNILWKMPPSPGATKDALDEFVLEKFTELQNSILMPLYFKLEDNFSHKIVTILKVTEGSHCSIF